MLDDRRDPIVRLDDRMNARRLERLQLAQQPPFDLFGRRRRPPD